MGSKNNDGDTESILIIKYIPPQWLASDSEPEEGIKGEGKIPNCEVCCKVKISDAVF